MNSSEWKPTKKQTEFIRIPPSVTEGFYGGAAGGGKSELLILLPILYGFHKIPGFKGLILRRTYGELDEELVIRSSEYYPSTGGVYTGGDQRRWKWSSYDSYIKFGHAQHEQDIRRYDTTEYQYIAFDELTSFTMFQYTYMFSRLRSTIPGLIPISRSASNPGNVGHGWVRDRFIKPYPQGGRIILDQKTKTKRVFIPSTVFDNPYILDVNPTYLNVLELLPESEKRAKLYGDWWTFSGQAFGEWRVDHFEGEPENAKHVIEEFDIPEWWPRILAIDWGFSAALYACWGAVAPNGRYYIYREYERKKAKVDEWSIDIKNLSGDEEFADIVLDWNCFESRGEDQTIAEQFQSYSGLNPRPADKGRGSRVSGKILLQDFLRWTPKKRFFTGDPLPFDNELATSILRNKGLDAYNSYLSQYTEEEPETDIPRLQVFETCKRLIEAIPLCVLDEKNPEDVAEFNGDDPYDCIRYSIRSVKRYLDRTKKRGSYESRVDSVREDFQNTKDVNTFQHRMGVIATKSFKPKPVRIRRVRRFN